MEEKGVIKASPSKRFFIEMLTKDISIQKAIFDLVDNSIDAATSNSLDLKERVINIEIKEDLFTIHDNCGGIKKDIAINYAFNFGRPDQRTIKDVESIGRFGVGMKRCIFKLGNYFKIITNDGSETFIIEQDINEWKKSNEWEFEFRNSSSSNEINMFETKVEIKNLNPNISKSINIENFIDDLKKELSVYYSLFILKGLKISVNGELVKYKDFILVNYEKIIEPRKIKFVYNNVECQIASGISPLQEDDKYNTKEAGWYIFCNNRLVIKANKDTITGWGEESIASYHNNYAMFRGFVFLNSDNVDELPLNTTKDGIDLDSEIYTAIKMEMKKEMKDLFKVISKINKKENLHIKKKIKEMKNVSFLKTYDENIYSEKLIIDSNVLFPKKAKDNNIKISFSVEKDIYELVKDNLGVDTKEDVGLSIFEYYVNMNEL